MARNMKAETKNKFRAYILECIQLEEYGINTQDPAEKLQAFVNIFNDEYSYSKNNKRFPLTQVRLQEWLMGLPTGFNVVFNYHEIEAKASEIGITYKSITDKWFQYLACEIVCMCNDYNVDINA